MLLNNGPLLHLNYASLLILLFNFTITDSLKRWNQSCFIHEIKNSQELLEFKFSREALRFSISCLQNTLVSLLYPIDNYRFPQEPIPKRYSFTKEKKTLFELSNFYFFLWIITLWFLLFYGIYAFFKRNLIKAPWPWTYVSRYSTPSEIGLIKSLRFFCYPPS